MNDESLLSGWVAVDVLAEEEGIGRPAHDILLVLVELAPRKIVHQLDGLTVGLCAFVVHLRKVSVELTFRHRTHRQVSSRT